MAKFPILDLKFIVGIIVLFFEFNNNSYLYIPRSELFIFNSIFFSVNSVKGLKAIFKIYSKLESISIGKSFSIYTES